METRETVTLHIPRFVTRLRRAARQAGPYLARWLPSRGSVLLTFLVIVAALVWARSAGAFPFRAPSASTASTSTIAYQGRLANAAGQPLTGQYGMIFRLYNAATGGVALWEEHWTGTNSVRVSDGLFNVMLGSLLPIPQGVIAGSSTLWLGITVGADSEMAPRVQLGSVPYAMQALTVPDGSIGTAKIADGAVTQAKLALSAGTLPEGWVDANETWTYASASTITVPAGATTKYGVGDRIRCKQGAGYKYVVLTAVADTLLKIMVNTSYAVGSPTAITDNYYSHELSPIGYPHWFALAVPTWNVAEVDDGSGGQPTTTVFRGRIDGKQFTAHIGGSGVKVATNSIMGFATGTLPTTANTSTSTAIGSCHLYVVNGGFYTPGSLVLLNGYYYFVLADNVTDNTILTSFGGTFSYEI